MEFSVLDLLDLPHSERELFLEIVRDGPQDAPGLAAALGQSLVEIQASLESLRKKGRIRLLSDGRAEVQMGRIGSRTTLPAKLWPALLAPQRLYSEQEIAVLKTAMPMLQFARARLSTFADHGPNHALRVKTFATQLGYVMGLTETELRLIRAAALFHDIGNIVERKQHHVVSQETVERLAASGELPFTPDEAALVGLLCRWHRREYDPERVDTLRGEAIRTGLAASVLRVADAMDIDSRRSDYSQRLRWVLEFFFPENVGYFTSLEQIFAVRIYCAPAVSLQVFLHEPDGENIQVMQLRKDLEATPLGWSIQELVLDSGEKSGVVAPSHSTGSSQALVVFPFDPHSLIMAALSRRQLEKAGYSVELLCYPDTVDGAAWLWGSALSEMEPEGIQQLVVIGDRPDPNSSMHLLNALDRWQSLGASPTILNRHEANWARVAQLRARGVSVTLGTDWAYFAGDRLSQADILWGRIAALCVRDPTMAAVRISPQEQTLVQGVLCVMLDALTEPAPVDTTGWTALAEPILDRIGNDDREFFNARAAAFVERYATPRTPRQVHGRVLLFDQPPSALPQALFWTLEAAIEQHGQIAMPGICYNTPYAIALWPEGKEVELVAISHWREEEAIPIRLLYPDIEPMPQGTESSLTVRLATTQADLVVSELLAACNR